MHDFHHDRGIQLAVLPHQHDAGGDYLLWCFDSPPIAGEFAAEFSQPSREAANLDPILDPNSSKLAETQQH